MMTRVLLCRRLLSFLPSNNLRIRRASQLQSRARVDPDLDDDLPTAAKVGYDIRGVIARVLDHGDFLEMQSEFAANIVIGFGRIHGTHRRHHRKSAVGAGRRASISMRPTRPRASSDSATRSISRW